MYKCKNGFTKQAMIDRINSDFKGKSSDIDQCFYRCEVNSDTRKCAAGLFIPDKYYYSGMEGNPIGTLMKDYDSICDLMPLDVVGMSYFQSAHDNLDKNDNVLNQRQTLINWVNKNVE